VHEVSVLVLLISFILKTFQEFEQDLLGDFAPATLQISESGQAEISVQFVRCRVERPADGESVWILSEL